ncbi:MAG: hypothetical protein NC827_01320 [Candidatus Omnitrophica bacterium]|nr:hypothetical protein [Candidatus Omnitrophota bacterium]MCM8801940.1 hypothetical protein [Candidatus Omnitrophota bacterium]
MVKILFFDFRHCEIVDGFKRKIEKPKKFEGNPIFVSGHLLEENWISLYGSVLRRPDGLWQMWYTTIMRGKGNLVLGYAESEDGIKWERVEKDAIIIDGNKTHFVFDREPHGAAIIYDDKEEREELKYKMICGASPSGCISVFYSRDGIHWNPSRKNPVIGTNPDCPMSLLRLKSGKYVAYHRPVFGDRRIARSESWDFVNWSEAKTVIDQSPLDLPQIQFYGLGAIQYGEYEIGTLWIYHTDRNDFGFWKMEGYQEPELAYTRTGYAWHRIEINTPWIERGKENEWDWGQIQPASSPVFLEDEIRFYYTGQRTTHGKSLKVWDRSEPRSGIGFAFIKPDRFVGLVCEDGLLLTRPFWTETGKFFINANVKGYLKAEITDISGKPIEGFEMENSIPIKGESISHQFKWKGNPDILKTTNRDIRFKIKANKAVIYSIFSGNEKEIGKYWDFRIPYFPFEREKIYII